MTEFEYDCMAKKRIAGSARHRVGRRRHVTLPSDRLTNTQLARRSGPCWTYRLNRPMTIFEFEAMPADLQRAYFRRLRQRGADDAAVGRMLGIGPRRLEVLQARCRVAFDQPDPAAWQSFVEEDV